MPWTKHNVLELERLRLLHLSLLMSSLTLRSHLLLVFVLIAGVKYPLSWIQQIKAKSTDKAQWRVLIDAAAYVPTQPLDLRKVNPDFVTLSFYKMFGYPTVSPAQRGKEFRGSCGLWVSAWLYERACVTSGAGGLNLYCWLTDFATMVLIVLLLLLFAGSGCADCACGCSGHPPQAVLGWWRSQPGHQQCRLPRAEVQAR